MNTSLSCGQRRADMATVTSNTEKRTHEPLGTGEGRRADFPEPVV